jgi:hypothetical protein
MEETTNELKARLRDALASARTGALGSASITQAKAIKDLWLRAERALRNPRSSAAALRGLIAEVRVFQ